MDQMLWRKTGSERPGRVSKGGSEGKAPGKKSILGQFRETGNVRRGDSCGQDSGLQTRGEDHVLLTSWGEGGW